VLIASPHRALISRISTLLTSLSSIGSGCMQAALSHMYLQPNWRICEASNARICQEWLGQGPKPLLWCVQVFYGIASESRLNQIENGLQSSLIYENTASYHDLVLQRTASILTSDLKVIWAPAGVRKGCRHSSAMLDRLAHHKSFRRLVGCILEVYASHLHGVQVPSGKFD
jgi:hypothetical protein